MVNKHFLKILFIFVGMILLGIIGSLVVSYIDKGESKEASALKSAIPVAN